MKDSNVILERARNIFFAQWEEMLRLRQLVLKNCEHEDIHDLRVASRRFRAALNLLGPLSSDQKVTKLTRRVRALTRTLGDLRNLDEALVFFGAHAEQADLTRLMEWLADRRSHEQCLIIETLKQAKIGKLDALVRGVVAGLTMEELHNRHVATLTSYLSSTSIILFETVHALLPAALRPEHHDERHALRIAIKKWRYFLETVAGILEQDYSHILDQLKKYQTLLGSMNDMTVFGQLCREAGCDVVEQEGAALLLRSENDKLFEAFVDLVATEPLQYSFVM